MTLNPKSRQVLTILATPSFASWLDENGTFIPLLLKELFLSDAVRTENQNGQISSDPISCKSDFDVVCACVDGLAPMPAAETYSVTGQQASEGISIFAGTGSSAPKLWEAEASEDTNDGGKQSSLSFTTWINHRITLPLANTLFTNGKTSTLIVSTWKLQPDQTFKRIRSAERNHVSLTTIPKNLFTANTPMHARSTIPAIPLTPVRRIISGLGNIVRQIQFDEGAGPASRELETCIDDYQKNQLGFSSAVAVWALIIPAESMPQTELPEHENLLYGSDSVRQLWGQPPNTTFIGYWLDHGAKVCRVRKSTIVSSYLLLCCIDKR